MINKEEKKAINLLKVLKLSFKDSKPYKVTYTLANGNEYTGTEIENIFETILNLTKKQENRIKELEEINAEHQKLNGELRIENNKNKKLEHKIREIIAIYDNSSDELTVLPNNEVVCLSDIAEIIDYLRELLKEAEETKDECTRTF